MNHQTRRAKYNRSQLPMGYILILPAMLLFAVFFIYSLEQAAVFSLMDWSGIGEMTNIGLRNYQELFSDQLFWQAFINNWYYAAGIFVFGVFPGLILAYILSQPNIVGRTFFRSVYFFPRIISAVVYGTIWKWIYDPRRGLIKLILNALGIHSSFALLGDVNTVMLGVVITGGWTYFGFCMVVFISGFMGVDPSLRESARLDGANRFQIFTHVDLPQIQPILNTMLIYTVIDSFKVYDLILVLTSGGPNNASQILTYYIYKQAFILDRYGYGSAASILLGLLMIVFVIIYNSSIGKER
jgi:ABC-type sugar transport system permease subunit